jgi:hypothetical protein
MVTILDITNGPSIGSGMQFTGALPSQLEVRNTATGQEIVVRFSPMSVQRVAIP